MSRIEEAAEQTAIRRQLLKNGYVPLANDDKRCMLSGWSKMTVTDQTIDNWADQTRYRATGIRLERGVAMLDIDINDAAIIAAFEDALPASIWQVCEQMPVRAGKGAKQAWLFRTETPFLRYASGAFCGAGEDPEGENTVLHRVEVFGGAGGGRQMGAFGAHTVVNNTVAVAYGWIGPSPLDVPAADLPVLTEAEVAILCDTATAVMEQAGWVRHERSASGLTSDGKVVFDLTEEMMFDTKDWGLLSLADLGEVLSHKDDRVRLSAAWLEGPAARNKTRCIASLDYEGEVQVFETAAFTMHKAKRLEPKTPTDSMVDRLREMTAKGSLFSVGTQKPEPPAERGDMSPEDILQQAVDVLLQEYAFAPALDKPVVPVKSKARASYSLANFRTLCRPLSIQMRGKRGGVTTVNPVDIWLDSADRIDVCGHRFDPRKHDHLIWSDPDDALAVNRYRAVEHTTAPTRLDIWQRFLEHLLPVEREREWFLNWLAAKVQKPWLPNCGVIMVAPKQGTGRGTLFDILTDVLRYVEPVSALQLMGGSGQGQYTEWLEDALLVVCDEVLAGGDTTGNMTWKRQEAYERIKTLIDPRKRLTSIIRKGVTAYKAEVFASFLLATNNLNALPIAQDDRRLAVLQNARLPMSAVAGLQQLMDEIRTLDEGYDAGFISAVYHDLAARAVDWDEAREAPMWAEQRLSMLEANKSDLDEVLEQVLCELPGDYILSDDLRKRIAVELDARGLRDEIKGWWNKVCDIIKQDTVYGWARMTVRQHVQDRMIKEKRATVYYRDAEGVQERWNDTCEAARPALWAEGSNLNATLSRARKAFREKGWVVEE